ncbi:MAG: RluA family pseudouridine synthase [Tibeticola sp.]|nr:RluA family pseudouridine synthase [Tibeticola sp.]
MSRIIGPEGQPQVPDAARVCHLTVDESGVGQRLDNYLLRQLKGVPKTHVYRIIRSGEVRVNKARAQADTRLQCGDLVRVPPVRVAQAAPAALRPAPPRDFEILYEDEALLAIHKPAGVAVHGGSGVSYGVIEQLRQARPEARFLELVHRLDRETSGILLVARRRSALTRLQEQFRSRQTGKTYLAWVLGEWPQRLKVLDAPLKRYLVAVGSAGATAGSEGERRVRVATRDDPDAQAALSLVRVRERAPGFTCLEVTIKTGRTHQIRVHLASAGYPIAGDDKYGDFDRNKALTRSGLRRMALHAWKLEFDHPMTGARMALEAAPPPDLEEFWNHVRNRSV